MCNQCRGKFVIIDGKSVNLTTAIQENKLVDILSTVGTPYLLKSFIFLHNKIAFASGFFFAVSINRKTGCLDLLKIVTSPA